MLSWVHATAELSTGHTGHGEVYCVSMAFQFCKKEFRRAEWNKRQNRKQRSAHILLVSNHTVEHTAEHRKRAELRHKGGEWPWTGYGRVWPPAGKPISADAWATARPVRPTSKTASSLHVYFCFFVSETRCITSHFVCTTSWRLCCILTTEHHILPTNVHTGDGHFLRTMISSWDFTKDWSYFVRYIGKL